VAGNGFAKLPKAPLVGCCFGNGTRWWAHYFFNIKKVTPSFFFTFHMLCKSNLRIPKRSDKLEQLSAGS
jgi:hypothetical protein